MLKINEEMLEKARHLGHDRQEGQRLSDLELLAELQHYGAATCLIDFTRNALFALWIACQHSSSDLQENGKVIVLRSDDPARFRTVDYKLTKVSISYFFKQDNNGRYQLYQWEPKYQNNRIIAQQSVFVFGGTEITEDDKCVIMKSKKQTILASLDKLSGINESSVFPDFDGFARLHAQNKPYIEPDVQSYLQRAIETHQAGKRDDAIAYYTEVISLQPEISTLIRAHNGRGQVYDSKDEYELAIKDYNQAIQLNPNKAEAYNYRGIVYGKNGNLNLAIKDFNKAIQLNPHYTEAYYNRGFAYGEKGEVDLAISGYNKAIQLNIRFAEAYYNRGAAYSTKGEVDLAILDLTEAIRLNPNEVNTYIHRGTTYGIKGMADLAIEDFNKAIQLNSELAAGLLWTRFCSSQQN